MRPRERVVVREDARNDDGRQVKASQRVLGTQPRGLGSC